jgi:hypothetical protein
MVRIEILCRYFYIQQHQARFFLESWTYDCHGAIESNHSASFSLLIPKSSPPDIEQELPSSSLNPYVDTTGIVVTGKQVITIEINPSSSFSFICFLGRNGSTFLLDTSQASAEYSH